MDDKGEGREWGWHLELAEILVSLAVAKKWKLFVRQFGGDIF